MGLARQQVEQPQGFARSFPPYGEGITYWPLVEILRTLLKVQGGESREALEKRFNEFVRDTLAKAKRSEDPAEVASAIIRSIGSGLGGDGSEQSFAERREIQRSTHSKSTEQGGPQAVVLRAWRALFESIAQQEPLILVIDDLQWADEALLDLLEYLTDRITDVPILFLCPARPDFLSGDVIGAADGAISRRLCWMPLRARRALISLPGYWGRTTFPTCSTILSRTEPRATLSILRKSCVC